MKLLFKIIKVLATATLIYIFMGFTICSQVYGPSIKLSEKSNNYHMDFYGIYYCKDHKMFCAKADRRLNNMFRLEDVDGLSFEVIGENFAKDKYHVYYQDKILENMDPTTFHADSFDFASDRTNLYWKTYLLEGINPSSYKVLKDYDKNNNPVYSSIYVKDSNYIYKLNDNSVCRIDSFDAPSFETIGTEIMMDKNNIRYNNNIVNIDRKSIYALKTYNSQGNPIYTICDKDWLYENKSVQTDSSYKKMLLPTISSDGYKFEYIEGTQIIKCGRKIIIHYADQDIIYHTKNDTPKINVIKNNHILRIDNEFEINCGDSIPISAKSTIVKNVLIIN